MSRGGVPIAGGGGDSGPQVRIRKGTPEDLEALGRLGALLVRTHHQLDAQRFMRAGPGTAQGYSAYLGDQLGDAAAVILVAEREGEVVGYVYGSVEGTDWMTLRGPAGVVHDLIVEPAHRGGGVGRKLLESAVDALRVLGAPRVVLSTAVGNDAARRLFTSAGFRPTMIEMTREI